MAWLKNSDDDWLTDTSHVIPEVLNSKDTVSLSHVKQNVLDLTSFEEMEPLHTLPEPPPCAIHFAENVSYFVIKVPSLKHLRYIQDRGICCVSYNSELDLNIALGYSSSVILIFSIMGSHTFDGYGVMKSSVGAIEDFSFIPGEYPGNLHVRPTLVQFLRKGTVPFSQIGHIRDDSGLGGRPVSAAKDGCKLGIAAGRTLCRSIDKRAYKDDPVHYTEFRINPQIFPEAFTQHPSRPKDTELEFLNIDFDQYIERYQARTPDDIFPSLKNIVSLNQ